MKRESNGPSIGNKGVLRLEKGSGAIAVRARRVGVQQQRGRLGISRFYVAGSAPSFDVRPNPARRDYHAREPQLRQLFLSISGRKLRYAGLRAQRESLFARRAAAEMGSRSKSLPLAVPRRLRQRVKRRLRRPDHPAVQERSGMYERQLVQRAAVLEFP